MKIPSQATCVFKGKIFDVYQWEQQLYNDTYTTFEMLKRPDTTQVIAVCGDNIVLAHEEQPGKNSYVTPFGGRIEIGEDPLEGAKRELLEESGMISDDWELWLTENEFGKIEWTVYTYIARNCQKVDSQHLDGGERITCQEYSFESFLDTVTAPSFRSTGITQEVLRMRLDPEKLEPLRKKLFKTKKLRLTDSGEH